MDITILINHPVSPAVAESPAEVESQQENQRENPTVAAVIQVVIQEEETMAVETPAVEIQMIQRTPVAAVILAADALSCATPGSGIFRGPDLPRGLEGDYDCECVISER